MRNDLSVSESIDVDVPALKVWDALTKPELIKAYLFGTETITDWKVGSPIIFQGDYNGQTYKDKGIVTENNPMHSIKYLYWSGFSGLDDSPENYSTVAYTVESLDDTHTRFTWTQTGFADETGYGHSKNGMAEFLKKIKEVMEG